MSFCKHFKGDRPCKFYWVDKSCDCKDCKNFEHVSKRILLIKLGAIGDVVRITPLAKALKEKYPNAQLTWLVDKVSKELIIANPYIDRVLEYNFETYMQLVAEQFDILINLEKDPKTCALAMHCQAKEKIGYALSPKGYLVPFNKETQEHFEMCMDNYGKKTQNRKSYQELMFDIVGIPFNNNDYELYFPDGEDEYLKNFKTKHGIKDNEVIIGMNTGCGPVYPHKKWTDDGYKEIIRRLRKKYNAKFIFFGTKSELELNKKIINDLAKEYDDASLFLFDMTAKTTLTEFGWLLKSCNITITGDTSGLHISLAMKTPTIAVFGPTPWQEIHMYDRGVALYAKDLDCMNCYDQFKCTVKPNCMERISITEMMDAIEKYIRI